VSDEAEHRHAELLGKVHQAHGLAVAFRVRHAEIVLQALLGGAALLVTHDHDRAATETRKAADDRLVIAEVPVAGEFLEILEEVAR
jgi:hypothetical protein